MLANLLGRGSTEIMGLIKLLKTKITIVLFGLFFLAPGFAHTQTESAEKAIEGRSNLSGVPAHEAKAIENACDSTRRVRGPADYYRCLQREVTALRNSPGHPDLSGISAAERAAIENACDSIRRVRGPADYYQCLQREVTALRNSPGRPDLSGIAAAERAAIENACDSTRRVRGPADYYRCLQREVAALQKFLAGSAAKSKQATIGVSPPAEESIAEKEVKTIEPRSQVTNNAPKPIDATKQAGGMYQCRHADGSVFFSNSPIRENCRLLGQSETSRIQDKPSQKAGDAHQSPKPTIKRDGSAELSPPAPAIKPRPAVTYSTPKTPQTDTFWLKALTLLILFFVGRAFYKKLPLKHCIHCSSRTKNDSNICDSCQRRIDNETAKAQERERQERETQRKAEEAKRQEEFQKREQDRRTEEKKKQFTSIDELQKLTGQEFETLIASLFERDGFKLTRRGGSGDEGIDLVLHLSNEKDVVQCKRWKSDIGSPVVREFYGSMMHVVARHGFIITTASFSQSARDFSVGKPIILIDGRYLLSWINGNRSARDDAGFRKPREAALDPYEVLQVRRDASKEEIRAAYLNLIKQYHPDKVSHLGKEFQQMAKDKTQAFNRAYEILTSTKR